MNMIYAPMFIIYLPDHNKHSLSEDRNGHLARPTQAPGSSWPKIYVRIVFSAVYTINLLTILHLGHLIRILPPEQVEIALGKLGGVHLVWW